MLYLEWKYMVKMSPNCGPRSPINNIPALVQIMAWRRPGDKPLSEPMFVNFKTNIWVTRPQWAILVHCNWFEDRALVDEIYRCSAFKWVQRRSNLQANVSATIRLFGGDSSHTPFFDWQRFQDNTLYPLAIIHMEHINVLDFDDKSERNLCFSFGNSGIIFNGASAQLFPPREKW